MVATDAARGRRWKDSAREPHQEGRGILNFSEWDQPQAEATEVGEVINEGEMPPLQYKLLHSSARLSDTEKQDLIDGLARTYQQDPPGP